MNGVFVTGTDTGVGKTFVSAALCAALRARGVDVAAYKPVVTGLDEPDPDVPMDHDLLRACAGRAVAPYTFGPPVSPHLAAELAGVEISPNVLRATVPACELLVAEGVGGALVPLTREYSVRDLMVDLGLPVVVAARPGLGTINHTLMTLEALRAAQLIVKAVVVGPWPEQPSVMERSNLETIALLGAVEVLTLPRVAPTPEALAVAGAPLSHLVLP